ncbi:hypothetical protein TNCV_853991 [Trichonephila clavipes]|nr:hypothetical protein TNCV_853991 [Trichonephila clavipes]
MDDVSHLISSIRLPPLPITKIMAESVPELDEIGIMTDNVVDPSKQPNLEVNTDNAVELLNYHIHDVAIDEIIEMNEQGAEKL